MWGPELDFSNGAGTVAPGNSAAFDLDTDVAGVIETKWLYLEVPLTGPGSILPMIPVASTLRGGAQPASGHEYKFGLLLGGDIPGFTVRTTWGPTVRSTLTYVQIGERVDRVTAPGATEDWAGLASLEVDIVKGLTLKPTYSYAEYDSGNSGSGNLGTEAKNGFNPNALVNKDTRRHTFGADLRWTSGPFTLQPTFLVQLGEQEINPVRGRDSVDIRSWIADVTGSMRVGPLLLSARGMFTPGMAAQHRVVNGSAINYYQSINPGFAYMTGGWTEIQTSNIQYNTALLAGAPGLSLGQSPSYDKYGRLFLAGRADYQITPAYTLYAVLNSSWTDEKVDTDGVLTATGISNAGDFRGDARYLNTELMLGQTWRFAPNVALDGIFAYMWTGDGMNHRRTLPAARRRPPSSGRARITIRCISRSASSGPLT